MKNRAYPYRVRQLGTPHRVRYFKSIKDVRNFWGRHCQSRQWLAERHYVRQGWREVLT